MATSTIIALVVGIANAIFSGFHFGHYSANCSKSASPNSTDSTK